MGLLRQRNSPMGRAFLHHQEVPAPGLSPIQIAEKVVGIAEGVRRLGSDPNKFVKRQQAQQTLLDFIELLTGEAQRQQKNIQGVKTAERVAPLRAQLMASLFSGGLEGFGSEFSLLGALAKPRSFQTTDAQGNQATSLQGPDGPPASPEELQKITRMLEPAEFLSLREKGRAAAAGQTPESLFTPTESGLPEGGLPSNMQFGVNKPGDLARQREILGQAGGTGLSPEQEQRFGAPVSRAAGGPVSAGQSAIVGERGPEIIRPNRDSVVDPNPEDHNRKQLKKVFDILSERGVGI